MKILWRQGWTPLWRLLKEYRLRKNVGDTDLRDTQEAEIEGFVDHLYKVDWERGKKQC